MTADTTAQDGAALAALYARDIEYLTAEVAAGHIDVYAAVCALEDLERQHPGARDAYEASVWQVVEPEGDMIEPGAQ